MKSLRHTLTLLDALPVLLAGAPVDAAQHQRFMALWSLRVRRGKKYKKCCNMLSIA